MGKRHGVRGMIPHRRSRTYLALLVAITVTLLLPNGANGMTGAGHAGSAVENADRTSGTPNVAGRAVPALDGVGAIVDVDNLLTDQLVPGSTLPAVQTSPASGVLDPVSGNIWVRGSSGATLSVVNGTTDRLMAELTVGVSEFGYSQIPSIAVDPINDHVFVTNSNPGTVSVINGTTDAMIGSIPVLGEPTGIAADTATGDLFVTDSEFANVTVLSGKTASVITNIPVGKQPNGIVYDPTDHYVFVANYGTANVTVINAVTDKVVQNLPTGTEPLSMAWDSSDDYLDVANYGGHSVSIFSAATGGLLWTYPLGTGAPVDLSYSSLGDQLVAVSIFSDNATVIDQSPYGAGGSLTLLGSPQWSAYDATDHAVFVACNEVGKVMILTASPRAYVKNLTIPDFPVAVVVDSANGDAFSVDSGSSSVDANVTVIDPSTHDVLANIPLSANPWGMTADPSVGAVVVADEYGNATYAVDEATLAVSGHDRVGDEPIASAYDPRSGNLYVVNRAGSNLSTIGPAGTISGSFASGIILSGATVDSANGVVYVSSGIYGNVTAIDPAHPATRTSILIGADEILGGVLYDPHSNEVYAANWGNGTIAVIDPATNTTVGHAIHVGSEPASLTYDPSNHTVFVVNTASGNISVIDDGTNQVMKTIPSGGTSVLAYDSSKNAIYAVGEYFSEVSAFNATTYASLGAAVMLGNLDVGGIAFDPVDQRILVSEAYGGALLVIGPATAPPSTYPITFTETGLAPSTDWSVTLTGGPSTNSSVTTQVGFTELNGSYPFTVGAVAGYRTTTPSGTAIVNGAPVPEAIYFLAKFGASLAPNASSIRLGDPVTLTTSLTGGTSPYEYAYSLPSPCTSVNAALVVCTPTRDGTFHVDVNVTDSQGQVRQANASFTVQSGGGGGGGPSSSPPNQSIWDWIVLVVIAVVALLAVAAYWMRRHPKTPPPPASHAPSEQGSDSPGPPAAP
ncbi:MAG: YncE family protein [Thermoplasmata archaeon]